MLYSKISARVLSYHAVGVGTSPMTVTRENFERQMIEVAERWTPADLRAFRAAQRDPSGWPADAVLVTFDDALECVYTEAYPILERLGIPFTIFVPTALVGGEFSLRGERLPMMSWSQIDDVVASGKGVCGSHTQHHRLVPELSGAEAEIELAGSKRELEARLGTECFSFCYPKARVDGQAMRRVRSAGYEFAFGAYGRTSFGTPMLRLRRLQIEFGHDLDAFRRLLGAPGYPLRARVQDIVWGYQCLG